MEVQLTRKHYETLLKNCDQPSIADLLLDRRFSVSKRLCGAVWAVFDGGQFAYLRSQPEYQKQLSGRVITAICRDAVERIHPKLFPEYRLSYDLRVPILWPIVVKRGNSSVLSCMLVESKKPQTVAKRLTLYREALKILGTYVAHFGRESCRKDLSRSCKAYLSEAKNWFQEAQLALVRDWAKHRPPVNPRMDPSDAQLAQLIEDVSFASAGQYSAGNEEVASTFENFLSKIGCTTTSAFSDENKEIVANLLRDNRAIDDPPPKWNVSHIGDRLPRY